MPPFPAPSYRLYGDLPVKCEPDEVSGVRFMVYNWGTGGFERNDRLGVCVYLGLDPYADPEDASAQDGFDTTVWSARRVNSYGANEKKLKGQGT